MKTSYEELIEKSNVARINALKCQSVWARNYWMSVSDKLMNMALNMPITSLIRESILREVSVRG